MAFCDPVAGRGRARQGSWEWDIPADTITWCDELYRIFGVDPEGEDLTYDIVLARFHPEDRAMVEFMVRRSIQKLEPVRFSARILTGAGQVRWIELRTETLTGPEGRATKMVGTALDITERRRAEEELEESELRFESGFQHSPIGIALASRDGRYLRVNPALCDILGRDEATLLGMRFQDLTHPDDVALGMTELRQMVDGDTEVFQTEKRYLRPDGTVVWAQLHSSVVRDRFGKASYFFSQVQDITEKKALTDSVQREREFLSAVLNNLSDGVIACDSDGVLTLVNRATRDLHGLPAAGLPLEEWFEDVALYQADGVTPIGPEEVPLLRALRGEQVQGMEIVIDPEQGRRRVVRVSGQAISDAGGNTLGAVAAMHDVTERKHAENDLAALHADLERRVEEGTAEAERANSAKSEFLSRMSHELRTPLNGILGFAQLLSMDELGQEQAESVRHILTGGRHLLELINEVLDLARIESGQLAMSIEPVPVSAVLDEALDLLRPQAAAQGVSLPAGSLVPTNVHVLGDQQRLLQIILNLLSNAVKYNVDGGTVSVTHSSPGRGRLRVSITDTGPGIAIDDMGRIFLPFERVVVAGTAVEGTGLGLAVSKRLAEAMGADIGLTSAPGRGSTFWVELSLAESWKAPECLRAAARPLDPGAHEATVLYIEDNPSNVHLVEALVQRLSHVHLLAARSGHAGLELAHQRLPDLILLDLDLPDLPGAEVLARLRANVTTAAIPVVVVSADATDSQVRRLLASGAKAYLTKPLDVQLFFAVVEEALREKTACRRAEEPAPAGLA